MKWVKQMEGRQRENSGNEREMRGFKTEAERAARWAQTGRPTGRQTSRQEQTNGKKKQVSKRKRVEEQ